MTSAGQEQGVERGAMATAEQEIAAQELRQHFDDYLQRVIGGERFRVTQDGRVVALLSSATKPTSAPDPNSAQEPMSTRDRLIAAGKLIPGKGNFLDLGPPLEVPPRMSSKEALDLEREERLP